MDRERWYSTSQAVHYSPGAVKFCLRHYFEFLHRGCWPPKPGVEGYESEGFIPGGGHGHQAPHEEVSAIAGELMLKLKQVGSIGAAIFRIYAAGESEHSIAYLMGISEHTLHLRMKAAFSYIWRSANPERLSCPICGQWLTPSHECPEGFVLNAKESDKADWDR